MTPLPLSLEIFRNSYKFGTPVVPRYLRTKAHLAYYYVEATIFKVISKFKWHDTLNIM